MIPFNHNNFLHAEGVSPSPQKVAYALAELALDGERRNISLVDPFCGDGTTLMIAGLNFSEKVSSLVGMDLNENAVLCANMNLEELSRMRAASGHYFPKIRTAPGNALTFSIPKSEEDNIVITDPPYGRRSKFVDLEGNHSPVDFKLFFKNLYSHKIPKVVFSMDSDFPEESLENIHYGPVRVATQWDRSF